MDTRRAPLSSGVVRDRLEAMGLPRADLHELPTSAKRFPAVGFDSILHLRQTRSKASCSTCS